MEQGRIRLQPLMDDGLITPGLEQYEVIPLGRWFLRNIAWRWTRISPAGPAPPIFSRTV